ncbi:MULTISPECIES: transposon-transfer assisting family protein [Lachnospiraceae]|uniref:transposon-transfer assisting family protein n=1 Tax=Lachnospiraceae TaxID=186803 RepID=UPI00363F23C2
MSRFTVEESNLMCIYNTGSRTDLLSELTEMQSHLAADETQLLALTKTVMDKLSAMSDEEFESLSGELIPDFDE